MFESVQRKRDQQCKDQSEAANYWAPSWKQMLTPQPDEGAEQIQRQPDVYAGVAANPWVQYDLDAMLASVGSGTGDSMRRARQPMQRKMMVGAVGDKYEQEADRVAAQVVKQINAPQDKAERVQGEVIQKLEEELQMTPMVQRSEDGGGEASAELECAINRARGSGQPLAPDLQVQMGQVMGADLRGVRVHTDAQSDRGKLSRPGKATKSKSPYRGQSRRSDNIAQVSIPNQTRKIDKRYNDEKVENNPPKSRAQSDRSGRTIQLCKVGTTEHYDDGKHENDKQFLENHDMAKQVTKKIYAKHKQKDHSGKCVTYWPLKNGKTMVIVTYANLQRGYLNYDTAYITDDPKEPENNAIKYNPNKPLDDM